MGRVNKVKRKNSELIKLVGENMRKYRKLKGLTISELSFHSDISVKQLGNYELGKVDPNLTMLNIIAEHLDIEICDLLKRT